MFDDFIWDGHTVFPQISDGGFQILGIPQDDCGNQEVEARRLVDLMLVAAIAHFTELVEEDPACKGVSSLASGQACAGSFPQFQAAHPFQGKEGPLQSPQFAQGNCESVLPGIGGQAFEDRRCGGGSGLD